MFCKGAPRTVESLQSIQSDINGLVTA